jgi:site-specific recombinase XerD
MLRTKSGLPKHCGWNLDREDGKRRVRFRKNGFSVYLTGIPWSPDFMVQYAAALHGVKAQATNIGANRTAAGTVNALVAAYLDPLSTSPFKTGAAETQRSRRNILENFREVHGDKPVFRIGANGQRTMLLTREHMQQIVNEKASTPFAQRNFLNTLRAMFRWALKEGRVPDDPTLSVTRERVKTTGYKTWSEGEIERFETKHPTGSRARLAFALLLYTGQRRGDVIRMGRQHIHDGWPALSGCGRQRRRFIRRAAACVRNDRNARLVKVQVSNRFANARQRRPHERGVKRTRDVQSNCLFAARSGEFLGAFDRFH